MSSCLISRRGAMGLLLVAPLALLSACAGVEAPGAGSPAAGQGVGSRRGQPVLPQHRPRLRGSSPSGRSSSPTPAASPSTVSKAATGLSASSPASASWSCPPAPSRPRGSRRTSRPIRLPLEGVYLVSTSMISLVDAVGASMPWASPPSQQRRAPTSILPAHRHRGGRVRRPLQCTRLRTHHRKRLHVCPRKHQAQSCARSARQAHRARCDRVYRAVEQRARALGRLEWIKLIGVLFEREAEAQEYFDTLAERITTLAAQAPTNKTHHVFLRERGRRDCHAPRKPILCPDGGAGGWHLHEL